MKDVWWLVAAGLAVVTIFVVIGFSADEERVIPVNDDCVLLEYHQRSLFKDDETLAGIYCYKD